MSSPVRYNKDGSVRKKTGPKPQPRFTGNAALASAIPKQEPEADDVDDLLGDMAPPEEEGGEPTGGALSIREVFQGVSVTWLAQAFGMDKVTVRKRIANCPPIGRSRNYDVFSLRQAAAFLVEPKVDIEQYLKSMRPQDLPPLLQDTFWSAALKRQKYEEEAKQLWRTEDVLSVFGNVSMAIKTQIQLWVENLDRVDGLTPKMRQALTQQTDELQETLYELLVRLPESASTRSTVTEIDTKPQSIEIQGDDDAALRDD